MILIKVRDIGIEELKTQVELFVGQKIHEYFTLYFDLRITIKDITYTQNYTYDFFKNKKSSLDNDLFFEFYKPNSIFSCIEIDKIEESSPMMIELGISLFTYLYVKQGYVMELGYTNGLVSKDIMSCLDGKTIKSYCSQLFENILSDEA